MYSNLEGQSYPASKCLATLAADKGGGDEVGIMVTLEMHIQKLLLPESFVTLAAGEWLLPCVCTLVHDHVAFLVDNRSKESLTFV